MLATCLHPHLALRDLSRPAFAAEASGRWTAYTSPEAEAAAAPLARGCYQAALLDGSEAWSGSTLRGRAARYVGRYRDSRDALVSRLEDADLVVTFVRVRGGRVHGGGRLTAVIALRSEVLS